MSASLIALFVAVGVATGFAAGLFGIGGGILLVPCLTLIFTALGVAHDHVVHMAIATSLATILFTSASSVFAHHRRGAVRWRLAALMVPGLVIGSAAGSHLAAALSSALLAGLFGVLTILSATRLLSDPPAHATRQLPGMLGMSLFGMGLGVLSGLIGGGGGFLSIPFLVARRVSLHSAVATSAALGFPIALTGTLSYIYYGWGAPDLPPGSLGYVYAPGLVVVALASVAVAPLGAYVAHRLHVRNLRRLLALLFVTIGGYMFWKAVHG